MKITLSNCQVVDTLLDHEVLGQRTDDGIIEATEALVDWLEDLEDDMCTEMELDPIALRCEYSCYTLNELAEMYDIDTSGVDADDRNEAILNYLNDHTIVIPVDNNNVIISEF